MKILFHNSAFTGGAPQSHLQYAKIAKKNKYEVISIGEKSSNNSIVDEYHKNGIKTINLERFHIKNIVKNFKILLQYLGYIYKIKPDLIHSITSHNNCYNYLIHKLTNIPIVYTIPGGKVSPFITSVISKTLEDETIIVFSEENRESLLSKENENLDIRVITNRMSFKDTNYKTPVCSSPNKVELLIISRLDNDKIQSINYIIDCTLRLIDSNIPVALTIAGGGSLLHQVRDRADKINEKYQESIFNVRGHVSNISSLVQQAHIVFGKGRSVLDGIKENRIGIVVNENNKMYLCKEDNLEELSNYNLTGRNEYQLEEFTMNDLKKLCVNVLKNKISFSRLDKIKVKMKKKYDIRYSEEEIIKIYKNNIEQSSNEIIYKPSIAKTFLEYIKLHVIFLHSKIKN